ncbi:gamma-glutamyl hydrolase-like isoform X2 [Rhodnius prolixus]|uniref:gamma-glutamyl hydrolase-like isoform X2 n=1 Tax=Rhodnius prolixus TaxID=13249 RepID=UPI003D18EC13
MDVTAKPTEVLILTIMMDCTTKVEANERPIIGILAQETSPPIKRHFPGYSSYISAAYVKGVESSGARAVPIFIGQNESYYRSLIKSINGLVLPGGNTWFDSANGYADAGDVLFEAAKELNNAGVHFPILGICLGVELLLYLDNNKREYRTNCYSKNVALPLEFLPNYKCSKLFGSAPGEVLKILREEAVTLNQHKFCITKKNLTEFGLDSRWRALSQNVDLKNDVQFISTIESIDYPFAGLQFHPEKNAYEWRPDLNNPHFPDAIKAARYFFDWIVNESRLNNNKFNSTEEEDAALIYNYQPTFTKRKLIYDQLYLFN